MKIQRHTFTSLVSIQLIFLELCTDLIKLFEWFAITLQNLLQKAKYKCKELPTRLPLFPLYRVERCFDKGGSTKRRQGVWGPSTKCKALFLALAVSCRASVVRSEDAGRFCEVADVSIVVAGCLHSVVDTVFKCRHLSYYEFIQ